MLPLAHQKKGELVQVWISPSNTARCGIANVYIKTNRVASTMQRTASKEQGNSVSDGCNNMIIRLTECWRPRLCFDKTLHISPSLMIILTSTPRPNGSRHRKPQFSVSIPSQLCVVSSQQGLHTQNPPTHPARTLCILSQYNPRGARWRGNEEKTGQKRKEWGRRGLREQGKAYVQKGVQKTTNALMSTPLSKINSTMTCVRQRIAGGERTETSKRN